MAFGTENSKPVTELDVLWIAAGLGCDGDTIAMTAATQPSIEDILLGQIPIRVPWSFRLRQSSGSRTPSRWLASGHSSSTHALTGCVGCHLEAVPAQSHAAPASRPLLAGVVEVQYAVIAFADAAPIDIREQSRRAMRQGREQVFWLASVEPKLCSGQTSGRLQLGTHGMLRHYSV